MGKGDTIFHWVVKDENFTAQEKIEILTKLLDNGLDHHSKNQNKETVLQSAIKTRAKNVIDILLQRKIDLDNSAALYFIKNEYDNLLELKNQSDDEKKEQESESASFLDWMITRGLDIDRPDRHGQNALFSAIDYNLYHLLPVLLKNTNQINYVEHTSRRTLLHMVLENKAKTRWSPSYSQRYGTNIVKILLDRGVSPESADKFLNTALHLAITNNEDSKIIQMLIDHTTNCNHKNDAGDTPFLLAIRQWLIWEKSNIDDDRKILQTLITKGADVNEGNKLGYRPLHIFAEETSSRNSLDEEDIELFELLISIGCNLNAKDLRGDTPLHLAVAGDNEAVVQKLIESGACINPRNNHGATPLHLITECNGAATAIAKMLTEHGANINAKDCKGFTPLHKAAGGQESRSDDTARLKLLLEHGADFCALSDEGYSVLDMAVWKFDRFFISNPEDSDSNSEDIDEPLRLEDISRSDFFTADYSLSAELEFLLAQWVKLYSAKLECSVSDNFSAFKIKQYCIGRDGYPKLMKVHRRCIKEVEILKNTFIDNNRTSFYDFLHMNVNSRRAHIRKKKLQELVHFPAQLKKQFPQYETLILSSYNETIRRQSLMEPAKIAWIKLTQTHLGNLCVEHIFSFLSNVEMCDLIEASGIDFFR